MTSWVHTPAATLQRKKTPILRDAARRQGRIAMATAEATGEGLEFLSDPVDRYVLLPPFFVLAAGGCKQTRILLVRAFVSVGFLC